MNNPAQKLLAILDKAYSISNPYDPPKFREAWSKVFGIDPNDPKAFMIAYSSLLDLLKTTKDHLENDDRLNNPRNQKFFVKIEAALSSLNFEGDMHTFSKNMDKETLLALSFISDHMDFVYNFQENLIDEEEISNIINEIDNLIENIIKSTLPEDVKSILFNNLNSMRTSLFTYKISGTEGMKAALDQAVGSLFMNKKAISPVATDENLKDFYTVMDRMNTLLSTGVAIKDLIGPVIGLLV